jgi:hypothetical protein
LELAGARERHICTSRTAAMASTAVQSAAVRMPDSIGTAYEKKRRYSGEW